MTITLLVAFAFTLINALSFAACVRNLRAAYGDRAWLRRMPHADPAAELASRGAIRTGWTFVLVSGGWLLSGLAALLTGGDATTVLRIVFIALSLRVAWDATQARRLRRLHRERVRARLGEVVHLDTDGGDDAA